MLPPVVQGWSADEVATTAAGMASQHERAHPPLGIGVPLVVLPTAQPQRSAQHLPGWNLLRLAKRAFSSRSHEHFLRKMRAADVRPLLVSAGLLASANCQKDQ